MTDLAEQVLRPLPAEGVQITVYSRLDSADIPPSSIRVCRRGDAGPPDVTFHMYNLTGGGTSGYHYDPMFKIVAQGGGEEEMCILLKIYFLCFRI